MARSRVGGGGERLSPETAHFYARVYGPARSGCMAGLRRAGCGEEEAEDIFAATFERIMRTRDPLREGFGPAQTVTLLKRAPPGLGAGGGALFPAPEGSGARALPPTATPAPGDAIFYGSGPTSSAHVGIVERVFPGGRITTIDGNFGDRVARSGPFAPSAALAYGMPGPVYGYARPPRGVGEGGGDG